MREKNGGWADEIDYDPIDESEGSETGFRRPRRDPGEILIYFEAIGYVEDGGDFAKSEIQEMIDSPDTFFRGPQMTEG